MARSLIPGSGFSPTRTPSAESTAGFRVDFFLRISPLLRREWTIQFTPKAFHIVAQGKAMRVLRASSPPWVIDENKHLNPEGVPQWIPRCATPSGLTLAWERYPRVTLHGYAVSLTLGYYL